MLNVQALMNSQNYRPISKAGSHIEELTTNSHSSCCFLMHYNITTFLHSLKVTSTIFMKSREEAKVVPMIQRIPGIMKFFNGEVTLTYEMIFESYF